MKKIIALGLLLVFVFLAVGCKEEKQESPEPAICYSIDGTKAYDLSAEEKEYITDLLNNANWVNDLSNCAHDIEFQIQNKQLRYASFCGVFDDWTNGKTTTVSEEQRDTINKMLGLE